MYFLRLYLFFIFYNGIDTFQFEQFGQSSDFGYEAIISINIDEKMCGSAIISDNYVLTVARCVTIPKKYNPFECIVQTGGTNLNNLEYFEVAKILVHDKFTIDVPDFNDVALLETIVPFNFHSDLYHIDLSEYEFHQFVNKSCVSGGWGYYSKAHRKFLYNEQFMFTEEKLMSFSQCINWYSSFIPYHEICAQPRYKYDKYHGDIGSPLVCDNRLVGLSQFGKRYLGDKNTTIGVQPPYLYVNINKFNNWIKWYALSNMNSHWNLSIETHGNMSLAGDYKSSSSSSIQIIQFYIEIVNLFIIFIIKNLLS